MVEDSPSGIRWQWSWMSSVWTSRGNWRLGEAGGGEGRQQVQALLSGVAHEKRRKPWQ